MDIAQFFIVFGVSAVKFLFGPAIGFGLGLSYIPIIIATTTGMFTSVTLFSLAGDKLRRFLIDRYFPNRRRFTKQTRKRIKFWRKYGLVGVAFLTPVLFSPIGGTLIAVSFGEKWQRIVFAMFISGFFWAFTITSLIYVVGDIFH